MTQILRDVLGLKGKIFCSGVTIGNFDGVHKGHQRLITTLKEESSKRGLTSIIITFDPHPLKVLLGNPPPSITPLEQKLELLSEFGPDFILILKFDRELAALEPEEFVKSYMVDVLGLKFIVIGHDYRFGRGGKGDYALLKELGNRYGFEVKKIDSVIVNGEVVSSTRVRAVVQEGNMERARDLLGRYYEVRGVVVEGQKRGGPLLGVPTANLRLVDELYPQIGVYAVKVKLKGMVFQGVANVGRNPTFGENPISIEVHLFGFSENIYGEMIRVQFVKRLRDEKKFTDIKDLKAQIHMDIERAKKELEKIL